MTLPIPPIQWPPQDLNAATETFSEAWMAQCQDLMAGQSLHFASLLKRKDDDEEDDEDAS